MVTLLHKENIMLKYFLKTLIVFSVLMGFFYGVNSLANEPAQKFPHGCRDLGYSFQNLMLLLKPVSDEENLQTIYFIHNKALDPIHIMSNRNPKDYTSPAYENVIDTDQWAAFAMNRSALALQCRVSDANGELMNCKEVLELCQYNRAKFGTSTYGTYWVVQSANQEAAIKR